MTIQKKAGKKIKNLKSLDFKPTIIKGNTVKPGNDYLEFKKQDIHQSIAQRFEEQVNRYPDQVAVKTHTQSLSYHSLNLFANRVAHTITAACSGREDNKSQSAALLFNHDADMIVGMMGVLKSGKCYIPLDAAYPLERLHYMLEDSEARLIVTNKANLDLAVSLKNRVNKDTLVIDINALDNTVPTGNPGVTISPGDMAYILYTSGSTGRPKGVMQNHCNVLHHARVYTNALHINARDKLSLFSSYSFDAAKMDIYGALLNGAALYPYDIKEEDHLQRLPQWLKEEGITIYHSIPTVYRYFIDLLTEPDQFPALRFIVLGGEAVFKKDIDAYKKYFSNHCLFINGLGPTESTVTVQYFIDKNSEITREAVPVGFPVEETQVYLLDEHNREIGHFGVGEIVFKSDYLAPGYWKKPEQTQTFFMTDPLTGEGRIYRTGDLGRRLADGAIEYAGRKDFQVKIRGFRVELGEIESKLDQAAGIKKSVVVCKTDDNGENFLVAYYTGSGDREINENHLVTLLKESLPDYMIPAVFFRLPAFPLTPTGKIDCKALSKKDISRLIPEREYEAPANETEEIMADLWKQLLKVDKISVNENFFVRGGNSLKAVLLVSRVHKTLDVKISLREVFQKPFIRELSRYLLTTRKDVYKAIEPVEKREYYPLSSSQKRLFFISQFEEVGTSFNMPLLLKIRGELALERYEGIFKRLVQRHETLRTSFHLAAGKPVQRIHIEVEFEITKKDIADTHNSQLVTNIVETFIRPFDLSRAPLFRVGIVSVSQEEHYLWFDTHHIVFDGTSMEVLAADFKRLYEGSGSESEPLNIQYKDFATWQNHMFETGKIKTAEDYWLNLYSDGITREIPRPELSTDFPRPEGMSYEGDLYRFTLEKEETRALKERALEADVSLYMLVLAIYNVFLSKITRHEDIIVATINSGRNHADTEHVIGVFVNMLAMRNYPKGEKTFREFLKEVRTSVLKALEHQDYPFETLVEKLAGTRDVNRHPLTDVGFTMQNIGENSSTAVELQLIPLKSQRKIARKDLNLEGFEIQGCLRFDFQYRTRLFKRDTMVRYSQYFQSVLRTVIRDPQKKIEDIEVVPEEERKKIHTEIQSAREEIHAEFDI